MMSQPELDIKSLRQCINCDNCGAENPSKRCSRCRTYFYCSEKCQKEHWTKLCHEARCISYVDYEFDIASLQSADLVETNLSCEVCFEEHFNNPIVLKDCKHVFCVTCYTEWFKCQRSRTLFMDVGYGFCPVCTKPGTPAADAVEVATMYACAGQFVLKEYEPMLDPSEAAPPPVFPLPLDARRQRLYDLMMDPLSYILSFQEHRVSGLSAKGHILRYIDPEEAIAALKIVLDIKKDARLLENFMLHVWIGDAYESLGQLNRACAHYKIVLDDIMTLHASNLVYENRVRMLILLKESSRCFFRIRDYEFAEFLGKEIVHMNREWPGSHVVWAQAQWALGKKEEAVKTMKRSLLYELPWDKENRQRNIAFLNRMLGDNKVDVKVSSKVDVNVPKSFLTELD